MHSEESMWVCVALFRKLRYDNRLSKCSYCVHCAQLFELERDDADSYVD